MTSPTAAPDPAAEAVTKAVIEAVWAAAAGFEKRFAAAPKLAAIAPGRVNLIGEHTDYNEGFVFPMAIDRETIVIGAPAGKREGARIRIHSDNFGATVDLPIKGPQVRGEPAWANYIRGVMEGFARLGHMLPALDLFVTSNVPLGAGLSSSAALEVATATAFEAALGVALEPMTKARLCQQAEHDLAGVPCGIMDQATSALARAGTALLIDCGDETVRAVPLPPDVAVLVTDTGVKHSLGDGAYRERRNQCATAAHALGIRSLRATSPAGVEAVQDRLDSVVYRRAWHVVTENVRTLAAAGAFMQGDLSAVGRFMYESHQSLKDNFEVSCPELDALVDLARGIGEAGGVYGARMTGGGFGGSTVTLVRADAAAAVAEKLGRGYEERFSRATRPFVVRASAGARSILLESRR